jgi:hypothetical protein
MKKLFIMAAMLLALSVNNSSTYAQSVKREGTTFVVSSSKKTAESTKTKYTWKVGDVEYPIYISSTGSCYIIKVSKKTGKEYKQYLPKEVCAEICKELNIEYKPKSK